MAETVTTLARLLIVREIQEDDSGATLHFQQGGQGRLALGDVNYPSYLRLARRSQERQHLIGVNFGERNAIVELLRADNDVPMQICEDTTAARVLLQGHDGVFCLNANHPESVRLRAVLVEAVKRKARIWFIAHKPKLALLDILPAGWAADTSHTCDGNGSHTTTRRV
jgi:hypothetical protein